MFLRSDPNRKSDYFHLTHDIASNDPGSAVVAGTSEHRRKRIARLNLIRTGGHLCCTNRGTKCDATIFAITHMAL